MFIIAIAKFIAANGYIPAAIFHIAEMTAPNRFSHRNLVIFDCTSENTTKIEPSQPIAWNHQVLVYGNIKQFRGLGRWPLVALLRRHRR